MEQKLNPLHLFEGYGIELEYMIVDTEQLDILPIADKVLYTIASSYESEVELGKLRWSNELVLHVIELKTNGPAKKLEDLPTLFNSDIQHINTILSPFGAQLMPTGLHPWMNPHTQTVLWPHENNIIYETYNKIFGCQGHGWSNIQSNHINLPFYDDEEFARLHTAVQLVLPLLPALAASTPIIDGKVNPILDNRLKAYCTNQKNIPSIAGDIIPERVFSKREYERVILEKMYKDIAPYDPRGIIQHEWLNSRGAIARFERDTIEIRVIDMQECALADLSTVFFIIEIIKALVSERWIEYSHQCSSAAEPLFDLFNRTVHEAEQALIDNSLYLEIFNYPYSAPCKAEELLKYLAETLIPDSSFWTHPISKLLSQGCLARRVIKSLKGDTRLEHIREIYAELCKCLARGEFFFA